MGITSQFLKFALLGAEWVMYVLVACSILSFSVIIERALFFFKLRGDYGTFVKELTERLNSADSVEKTAAWCAGHQMLEANVAAVGLERSKDGHKAMENTMNATIIASRTKLDKGLTLLGTLGNNTPFIGLFGTVIGIIQAFNALSSNNASGPEVVMASISEALVATAVGLMVAIPAVIAFNVLSRAVKTKMANSETVARIILSYNPVSEKNS
ncbi:MAG: MotA/TolQ/ExbB proton channel family protein [Betaproteobacteria bacterium]|nr:MotA/TolQ/ExbB proton channel family protein [Betaproteobacteria bacterium]